MRSGLSRREALTAIGAAATAIAVGRRATAAPPAGAFDLPGFVAARLAAGDTMIVVPPGRYRVTPGDRHHLRLTGLRGVTLDCRGVEMVCTETTRAVTVEDCRDVTVRGLVVDYDPLPFTQGRIVALSADRTIHEIELSDGYPDATRATPFKYEIFDPLTRGLRTDDRYPARVRAVGPRRLKVMFERPGTGPPERAGDLVVIGTEHAPGGQIPHAVVVEKSDRVAFEDVTLWSGNCFGFLEVDCDANAYRRCVIDRRPADDDPVKREDPRLRSLNADAFHSKRAKRGPRLDACRAHFMGDDAVNVNGDAHLITAANGVSLRVLAKHDMDLAAGDRVECVGGDGRRHPPARVVGLARDGRITDDERQWLAGRRLDAGLKRGDGGALTRAYAVTLDAPVPAGVARGALVQSADRRGNGFAVVGCDFGHNRSRGILIKAGYGEVRNNTLTGSRMAAILVAPEYWWLEAGGSDDLVIAGNRVARCGDVAIAVVADAADGRPAPAGAHTNVTITDNRVLPGRRPAIRVSGVRGLTIARNAVTPGDGPAVSVEHCSNVAGDAG